MSAAEEYCAFLERVDRTSRPEFLHGVHWRIADLYAAALRLPDVASGLPPLGGLEGGTSWDKSGSFPMGQKLKRHIGDLDMSKEVFGEEALPDRLSDDLADIYTDLKGGLDRWIAGDQRGEVLWEWSFSFLKHWAQHATDAMRLLWILMTFGYPDP